MAYAIHLAPRLLLVMLFPFGLMFFGIFFAAVTSERRRRNKAVRAILGQMEPTTPEATYQVIPHTSRYAYAMEQLQREQEEERRQLHFTQVRPIRFRSSHTGLSGKH